MGRPAVQPRRKNLFFFAPLTRSKSQTLSIQNKGKIDRQSNPD